MLPDRLIGTDWPAVSLREVTPSDTVDLADGPCRGLFIGTGGDLSVIAMGDTSAVVLPDVLAGILPVRASRVLATGTTATGIVALY